MKQLLLGMSGCILLLFSLSVFATTTVTKEHEHGMTLVQPVEFLYADVNDTGDRQEPEDPLLVMQAEDYKKLFGHIPLERMLRTQINNREFIVLDQEDIEKLDTNKDDKIDSSNGDVLYKIYFAMVTGTIHGSYIATTAKLVSFGKLKEILINVPPHGNAKAMHEAHDLNTEIDEAEFAGNKDVEIKSATKKSDKDMPWMGL